MDPSKTWKGLDLQKLISDGHTNQEISYMAGSTQRQAQIAVNRRGLKSNVPSPKTVRSHAESMKPLDAVNYLLGVLEQWLPALDSSVHEIDNWGIHFTQMQRMMLALLVDASPRVVSRDQILDCLYSTRADGEVPDSKVVDVLICHIRKKLPEERGMIVNVFGCGYRFERAS